MTRGHQPRVLAVLIDRRWRARRLSEEAAPSVTRKRGSGTSRAVLRGFAASVYRSRGSKAGRELA